MERPTLPLCLLTRNLRKVLVAALLAGSLLPAADLTPRNAPAQVFFSPGGGCTQAVVEVLGQARSLVLVQAYEFTSAPIAKALVAAHRRGVRVYVILDKSQVSERFSDLSFLEASGIPVWIDYDHAIAHNKVMVIDGETVITGSFNFTKAAEDRNAENLLVIREPGLAKLYADNWQAHQAHSQRR